jgi:dTDP-4-dehydrorhamnose reductase
MWTEDDPVNPVLTYGRQKAEVERYVLEKAKGGLVLRLGKVVAATGEASDMLGDWAARLESGEEIRCARDQVMSLLEVDDAVTVFRRLAESGQSGIFHVCGPQPVSRLDLLQTLAGEIGRHRSLAPSITACSLRDFPFTEPRPLNNSMSARKLSAVLGRDLADYRVICRKAAASRFGAPQRAPRGARSGERVK